MNVPSARSLPAASIVAAPSAAVWVKEEESSDSRYPWAATHLNEPVSDADVDVLLQSGYVILRVGNG